MVSIPNYDDQDDATLLVWFICLDVIALSEFRHDFRYIFCNINWLMIRKLDKCEV